MDTVLDGAFANPVLDSQAVFHALMHALANPGQPQKLLTTSDQVVSIPAELVSVLLAMADNDTLVWLDNRLHSDNTAQQFIGFHTGARIVSEPARANFAFATAADVLPPFETFNLGTQEYPDRSTTIVLAVPSFDGGDELVLRGPGIKDHLHISPAGLPEDFISQWADNRELFPRGIDLLLVSQGQVMGLPRSTRIEGGH